MLAVFKICHILILKSRAREETLVFTQFFFILEFIWTGILVSKLDNFAKTLRGTTKGMQ